MDQPSAGERLDRFPPTPETRNPPRDDRSFRIRGVPIRWELKDLKSFLEGHQSSAGPNIASLTREVHGRTKTATVTFPNVLSFQTLHLDETGRLSLPAEDRSPRNPYLVLEDGFLGITTLYSPPPEDHKVDIIAISGLGGHAFGSFKERGGAFMWLRDALPSDIPMARTMIYGYESTVAQSENIQNLEDLATSFCNSLLALLDGPTVRPIIFVAHSLGGLIVKETLIILSKSNREDHTRLNRAVYGIAFFGVPHDGMDISSLIPMVGDSPNRFLVESLSRINSQILSTQHREFHTALGRQGNSEVICFYETIQSPTAQKDQHGNWKMEGPKAVLVTKSSATHCRSWENGPEHICAIARTHSNIVKFGPQDHEYDKACESLRGLATRALAAQNPMSKTSPNDHLQPETVNAGKVTSPRCRTSSDAAPSTRKSCFCVPFSTNKRFVGRNKILWTLQESLFSSHTHQRVALVGLGGIGKTQVALQLAYWVKETKPDYSVFWVPAFSDASFEQAHAEIMKEVGIQRVNEEDSKESVQRHLNSKDAGKWFLIIDNADDIDVLFESSGQSGSMYDYLPTSDEGRILFTTRTRKVAVSVAGNDLFELPEMNEEEAKSYLGKSLVERDLLKDEQVVADFLRELTYLPLAITQAVAYLNTNQVTIADYLRLFKNTNQDRIELMSSDFRDSTRYRHTQDAVTTTWHISFHQISTTDESAIKLLLFIACLEPRAIPRSILPDVGSEQKLMQAIGTLCGYSFLARREDGYMFDMHRLVYLATQLWIEEQGIAEKVKWDAIKHLEMVFPDGEWEKREVWQQYLPHALNVLRVSVEIEEEEFTNLGFWVGRCLFADGRTTEAVRMFKKVVTIQERALADKHPSRLASQHELAGAYLANGQVEEAVQLLEEVVAVQERTLADRHPDRLTSQHELARAYLANGQVEEAVQLFEEVVAVQETLADRHPDRLASQHELAGAYLANGQVEEAVQLFEEVVAVQETLADRHPDRLASQHELAGAYLANGQVEEAVQLLEEVVAIKERTLADGHPDRLTSQHELARAYYANGQVEKAVQLLEEVVAIRQRILVDRHPDRRGSERLLLYFYNSSTSASN
ncbi:hypothetical protein EDB80DRAFT_369920 [Ilyonectria destructans]|nr:hypothetical protein EDB80DRAFT_369920 [Ilyonectria destructans]